MGISVFQTNGAVETWQPLTQTLTWCMSFWAWFTEMTCGNFCGWPKFEILTHIDTYWHQSQHLTWWPGWPVVSVTPRAAPPGVEAMRRTADLMAWTAATKSAGPWEKALAMSMAMAPGVENLDLETLKDVGKAAKPWKRLGKDWKKHSNWGKSQCWHGERSGPENRASRTSSDFCSCAMPLQSFRQKKFPLSHGCPMVVPWLHRSSRVQEPDAAYSVVLLSALGNWKVLLAKLQVGWGLFCHQGIRMKACQFSQWNG